MIPALYAVLGGQVEAEEIERGTDRCEAWWALAENPWEPATWLWEHCAASNDPDDWHGPLVTIWVDVRNGMVASFRVCDYCHKDVLDGVAHTAPWCVYAGEAEARYEVVKVEAYD